MNVQIGVTTYACTNWRYYLYSDLVLYHTIPVIDMTSCSQQYTHQQYSAMYVTIDIDLSVNAIMEYTVRSEVSCAMKAMENHFNGFTYNPQGVCGLFSLLESESFIQVVNSTGTNLFMTC